MEILPDNIRDAVVKCQSPLESAKHENNGKFELVADRETLQETTQDFIKLSTNKVILLYLVQYSTLTNNGQPNHRLIAWRFTTSTSLFVPENVDLDLIPYYVSGTPSVGGIKLEIGQCIHLTEDTLIEPSFACLVRIYERKD